MIKIFMANVNSIILGLTYQQEFELANKLSYTVGGFGSPSSTRSLYNFIKKSTYTGLIPQVLQFLGKQNIKYEVIDKRQKPESNANFSILKTFNTRDYQQEIVDRASSREIIQAATGAGKTFILASLIANFSVKPAIIIAPKVSLAEQLRNEISKFLGISVGLVGGGHNSIEDITICTPQSASDEFLESAKLVMWDECHNLPASTLFECSKKAKNAYYRIGVSATPWRDGGDDILIEAALSIRRPNLSINASKLIDKGYLVPCKIYFLPFKDEFEWRGNYHELYQRAIVNNEARNNMIIRTATKMHEIGRTTLILIKEINHGKMLLSKLGFVLGSEKTTINIAEESLEVGRVEFLSGRDSKERREAILKSVKIGYTKILIGSTIADEGLDLPILDCLILAGSGKSSTKAFQRIGRVLRLYDGKKDAIVFDIMDETKTFKRHALIREAIYKTEHLWKIKLLDGGLKHVS